MSTEFKTTEAIPYQRILDGDLPEGLTVRPTRSSIKELSKLVETKTRSPYNALKDAIRDAAYEAAPDEDD